MFSFGVFVPSIFQGSCFFVLRDLELSLVRARALDSNVGKFYTHPKALSSGINHYYYFAHHKKSLNFLSPKEEVDGT